jgi:hypothetical protein
MQRAVVLSIRSDRTPLRLVLAIIRGWKARFRRRMYERNVRTD